MKLKIKRSKKAKKSLFGSEPGFKYHISYIFELNDFERKIIREHKLDDYLLHKDKISEIRVIHLLSLGKFGRDFDSASLKTISTIEYSENRLVTAVSNLKRLIEYLSGFDSEYEYDDQQLAGDRIATSSESSASIHPSMKTPLAAGVLYGLHQQGQISEQLGNIEGNMAEGHAAGGGGADVGGVAG